MKLLAFVIWMLGWPLVSCYGHKPGESIESQIALFIIGIWIFVGILIYRKI